LYINFCIEGVCNKSPEANILMNEIFSQVCVESVCIESIFIESVGKESVCNKSQEAIILINGICPKSV
jgi:hypothetical protein